MPKGVQQVNEAAPSSVLEAHMVLAGVTVRWARQHGSIHPLCLKENQIEELQQGDGAEQRSVLPPSVWGLLNSALTLESAP